jgi:glycerol-3-phosphate dehydrogenase
LTANEWARSAQDILQRRTRHGLHLSEGEKSLFGNWLHEEGLTKVRAIPRSSVSRAEHSLMKIK